jgi:hypothetical protein
MKLFTVSYNHTLLLFMLKDHYLNKVIRKSTKHQKFKICEDYVRQLKYTPLQIEVFYILLVYFKKKLVVSITLFYINFIKKC